MDDHTLKMFLAMREHQPGWGTASFEAKAIVILHVDGDSANPIEIPLTHQVVLGRTREMYQGPLINLAAYEAIEKGVSRQHAALRLIGKTITLIDLSSMNGTFLNGQRLIAKLAYIVRSSDEIRLSQLVLQIYYEDEYLSVIADPSDMLQPSEISRSEQFSLHPQKWGI